MASSSVQLQLWFLNHVGSLQFIQPTWQRQVKKNCPPLKPHPTNYYLVVYKKKLKKKTSYSKSEIRKLKIQNFGLLPLTGCFHKFISATEGRNNQLFKNLNRKKKIYKKQVNLAPIEER